MDEEAPVLTQVSPDGRSRDEEKGMDSRGTWKKAWSKHGV